MKIYKDFEEQEEVFDGDDVIIVIGERKFKLMDAVNAHSNYPLREEDTFILTSLTPLSGRVTIKPALANVVILGVERI